MRKIAVILFFISFLFSSCDNGSECDDNGNPTIVFTNNKNFTLSLSYNNYAKVLSPGEVFEVTFLPAGQTLNYIVRADSKTWSDSFKLESCTVYDVQLGK